MERQFSSQLMAKAKVVLEKRSGRVLSDDEIEIMLDRLSELGLLFVRNILEKNTKTKNK